MRVITLAGSPRFPSRSTALLSVCQRALEHKVVLPLASGGSVAHMLAVDYALKPVLNALKAQEVLHGVFASDTQITHYDRQPELDALLSERIDEALETFWQALHRRHQPYAQAV